MPTLVLSPSRHDTGLHRPAKPNIVSPSTSPQWQSLPPLLSRLPPALLASPSSIPTPIAPLQSTSTTLIHTYQDNKSNESGQVASEEDLEVGYTLSHLPAIDEASLALHYALYKFRVLDLEHYATAPYERAFNWQDIHLPLELEREW